LQKLFEALYDKCLKIAKGDINKAMAIYHSANYMLDNSNLNARDYELMANMALTINTNKASEHRVANPLPNKVVKEIEKQAMNKKCPAGHVRLAGALKSVVVQSNVAVLTPWIPEDDINDVVCMQSSWGAPANDSIFKAGYLVVYRTRFKGKTSYLTDFSDIEDDDKGLTASGFSRIILALHDKIVEIDGARDAYNFFETLVKNVEQEVGEKIFVNTIKAYAATKALKLDGNTSAEIINCILAHKKPPTGASALKIDDSINIESGLELLYPFTPIVSSQWHNRRQDYGFVDGHYVYHLSAFKGAYTQQMLVGSKFKIMVAGDVSYVFAGNVQQNASIMEVSDSCNLNAAYSLKIDVGKKVIETNIDELLSGECDLTGQSELVVSPNFIEVSQTVPDKSSFTFKNDIGDVEVTDNGLPSFVKAGNIISLEVVSGGKNKKDERLTWGLPIQKSDFDSILPYLKILHGQNLNIKDSRQMLFQVQDKACGGDNNPAIKKISSIGKATLIAQMIPGLENFLLDN
jgi:hypothetical protein